VRAHLPLPLVLFFLAAAALIPSTSRAEPPVPTCTETEQDGADGTALSWQEAWDLALRTSPQLAAERARIAVAEAEIARATQRPNPELQMEASRETPHEAVGLAVPIETGGKRQRRIELAHAGVATANATFAAATQDARRQLRRSYFALRAAQERVATTEQLVQLAQRALGAAQERYQTGDVARLDVLQAQVAADRAQDRLCSARAERAAARAELDGLLARETAARVQASSDFLSPPPPPDEEAVRLALASSAELGVLDRTLAEQTARVALTQALRIPDVTVQPTATFDAQPEFSTGWRLALTIPLPIFTTGRAEVAAEQAALRQAQAQRDAAANRLRATVTAALVRARAARGRAETLRQRILQETAEIQSMMEESYRSGQSDLTALLQVLNDNRDAREQAIDAGLEYQNALADLEAAMGTPLP
jgi:cobalt-zinc-cadmium efflux system outer membrane protein